MRVYDFSEYYALDKGLNDTEIIKLDIDNKHSQKINQKLLGTWTLEDYKPTQHSYDNFKLKSFNLKIEESNLEIHIETSEDLIYDLKYKYEIGHIPDYFILNNMEPFSFIFDESKNKLIICYGIDSTERKYEYPLKIELKKQ